MGEFKNLENVESFTLIELKWQGNSVEWKINDWNEFDTDMECKKKLKGCKFGVRDRKWPADTWCRVRDISVRFNSMRGHEYSSNLDWKITIFQNLSKSLKFVHFLKDWEIFKIL